MMEKSAQELKSLVDQLHLRNPREVMGDAATSNLLASTVTASVSTIAALVGVTLVVFLLGGGPSESSKDSPSQNATAAATQNTTNESPVTNSQGTADGNASGAGTASSTAAASGAPASGTPQDTQSAVDAMGIGETADPDSKPKTLESRLDELLDGLE